MVSGGTGAWRKGADSILKALGEVAILLGWDFLLVQLFEVTHTPVRRSPQGNCNLVKCLDANHQVSQSLIFQNAFAQVYLGIARPGCVPPLANKNQGLPLIRSGAHCSGHLREQ